PAARRPQRTTRGPIVGSRRESVLSRHTPPAGHRTPAPAAHADMIAVDSGPDPAGGHPRHSRKPSMPVQKCRLHRSVRGGNGDSPTGTRFRCQSQDVIGEDFPAVLAAAQQGDEGAFAVLWRDGNPALLRYLRVVAPESAEDVTAETWVTVVRGL